MNTIRKFSFLALFIIVLSSCSGSFLDVQPQEKTSAKDAISNITTMRYAINGLYSLMQDDDYYNLTFTLFPELMSDNVYISRVNTRIYSEFGSYTVTPSNRFVEGLWNQIYKVVANANFIIQKGSKLNAVSASDKLKQKAMVGQAYAIKAEAYFDLVRSFAQPYNFTEDASHMGIPLVPKSTYNVNEISLPSRSTVKEVYNAIIKNFKKAINLLPTRIPGTPASFKGKITLNAAKALLSRVYLYKGDWKDCIRLATDVIESGQYSLLPTNELVDKYSLRSNSESIFEIVNSFTDNTAEHSIDYFYNQHAYGDELPTWDLYNIYSSTDVRRKFVRIGDRLGAGGETNVPIVHKFKALKGNFGQDVIVIRLAEVYLNRAEAEAHLAKTHPKWHDNAISDLKTIAKRADPSVNIDESLSGQALIDRILLERRKELAFEGQRLFDLTRNKMSFVKYFDASGRHKKITYPSKKTILPIPRSALLANPNLKQNPGY